MYKYVFNVLLSIKEGSGVVGKCNRSC